MAAVVAWGREAIANVSARVTARVFFLIWCFMCVPVCVPYLIYFTESMLYSVLTLLLELQSIIMGFRREMEDSTYDGCKALLMMARFIRKRWTPFASLLQFMDWLFFSPFELLFCTAKAEELVITSTHILSRYGAEWKTVSFTPVSFHPVSFTPTRLGVWNMNETLSKHFLWFMACLQLPSSCVCQTKSVRVQSPAQWWWLRVGS